MPEKVDILGKLVNSSIAWGVAQGGGCKRVELIGALFSEPQTQIRSFKMDDSHACKPSNKLNCLYHLHQQQAYSTLHSHGRSCYSWVQIAY